MRVRGTAALALTAALVATMASGTLVQGAPTPQAGAPIRLKAATFNPTAGESARIPIGLTRRAAPAGRGYYIVQAPGPITEEWKAELAAQGAELLDYIPDYAFKVRMSPAEAASVRALADVSYVGLFHPAFALSPDLADGQQLVRVRVERGGDRAAVAAEAAAAGAQLITGEGDTLVLGADRAQINRIANALDVAWIEPYRLNEKHDTTAGGIIGVTGPGGASGGARARGYDGEGQIVAVADTGIGDGTTNKTATESPLRDISFAAGRIQGIYNWPGVTDSCFQTIINDGAVDVDSGHGSHVAGSVLGSGDPAGFAIGMAPKAKLVFQATENYVQVSSLCRNFYGYTNDYYLTGLNDLYGLFQQAYNAGARIHANSWGSAAAGSYTANSVTADDFIWDNKDFAITFSAGNEGIDANSDGVIDNDSIGAPATAKNVITVGASENGGTFPCDTSLTYQSRDAYQPGKTCQSMGNTNITGTYGTRWPADYPADPIAGDLSGGNQEQMAAFSSRGPTDDGRIKPDVVAPGTWILSTYSNQYREGYGDPLNPQNNAYQSDGWGMPRNGYYKYFGGTSMSNPIAAGAAVVVRDYYASMTPSVNASSALVKATLINTAVDLLDENNDGVNDNDFPIPNNHEGWGRINIDNATDGNEKFVDTNTNLATGASKTYDVALGSGPLKITVVWSDYAAAANASVTLVNNLDLTVTSPSGTVYRGNVFGGGWSASGGTADNRNNVENVYIQNPGAGTWKIAINGANVPQGPQPFALVVSGASALNETSPPAPTTPAAPTGLTATPGSRQATLRWTDNSSNETGFKIERCTGAGCTNFAQIGTVGANVTSVNNTGLARNTTYRYRVRAYNAAGDSAYSNIADVITPSK